MPGRILWGWLGSSYVAPRLMIAGLALGMAGSVGLLALCSAGWPTLLVGVQLLRQSASATS
ncbi:MAG: hypothetical protein EXR29_09580 [Betaproteobacteria bacterium]|nr:hypothetical protein [Betaproteobacteria bacterium]